MLNKGVQSRLGNGEAISEFRADPIDRLDQIVIVDMPPLVARKRGRVADEVDSGSGSEIGSAVAGARVVGAEQICTGSRSSPTLSALMTHMMDPTVKIWPGYGRDEEPAEKTILFDKETAHPYLARQLSTEYRRQSTEGHPAMVD